MRHRPGLVLPFLLLCVFVPLRALQQPSPTSANDVVRKALAEQVRVSDLLEKYSYRKHIISESSDMKGRVTDREERVYSFAPCGDKTCITLESVNGRPPTPKELKEHDKMMKKEWERQAKKTAADKKKEENDDLFLSQDFLAVYDFAAGDSELHQGTTARVITFTPKPEDVRLADKDNRILTKVAGRLWIADVDQKIVAAEMHMVKPIKVWGGFAGAINNMDVRQEYISETNGVYLPKKNAIEMELRILLSKGKLKVTEEYSDYRAPVAPAKSVP
ncbi:MAG TPA: hypothetical protein VL382_08820 [Terriglobales bacterium]|jgi:hypothetical protein|nr:hypothetical protein [Terriglobales bacterium]